MAPTPVARGSFHARIALHDIGRIIAGTAALACVAVLALDFVDVFRAGENMTSPAFGTASAPYSDALGPWLEGGLTFLFSLTPPTYLYRPTIGVFWSSILAISQRVDMIPIAFSVWFLATVGATLIVERNDAPLWYATIAWLGVSALTFTETLRTLYIATTNVDLASFVFTLSGVTLLLWRPRRSGVFDAGLIAAALCLGVAAAIRGPMLLAGPFMIATSILLSRDHRVGRLVVCAALFCIPLTIDAVLQRQLGVVNNGVVALFCVYSDPARTWTASCHELFLAQRPSAGDVLRGYAGFVLSPLGVSHLMSAAASRAMRDLSVLQSIAPMAVLFAATVLATLAPGRLDLDHPLPQHNRRNGAPWFTSLRRPMLMFALVAGSLAIARYFYTNHFTSDLAWILLAFVTAGLLKRWRAFLCLGAYLAGMLFLCLMGLQGGDRLITTFSFTLYIGIALLVMETRPANDRLARSSRATDAVAFVLVAAIAFLYLGNLVVPSDLRTTYRTQVYGQPGTALKLSDDLRIDRSLYYTGDRQIIYTRHDTMPVGSVRHYRRLSNHESANSSFVTPNAFLE